MTRRVFVGLGLAVVCTALIACPHLHRVLRDVLHTAALTRHDVHAVANPSTAYWLVNKSWPEDLAVLNSNHPAGSSTIHPLKQNILVA